MSERFAKEVGVRILNDSLTINSTLPGAMNGQMGTVENMQIGSMIFHYPLITVAPPNALDSVMRVDAILGMDYSTGTLPTFMRKDGKRNISFVTTMLKPPPVMCSRLPEASSSDLWPS